jgi:hypothetical protein
MKARDIDAAEKLIRLHKNAKKIMEYKDSVFIESSAESRTRRQDTSVIVIAVEYECIEMALQYIVDACEARLAQLDIEL